MMHPSSSENLRLTVDPWIPRLPTPVLEHNQNRFASPPASRVSSTASIASLSDRNFAHLRPLPSPGPDQSSPFSNGSATSTPVTEEASPTGASKTHAFFSTPFSIAIARVPPGQPKPEPAPTRSTSLTLPKKKNTRDSLSEEVSEPMSATAFTEEPASDIDTLQGDSTATTPNASSAPSRAVTASASFFFGPKGTISAMTPAPPPNLEPIVKKKHGSGLPGLSTLTRLFPSRSKATGPVEQDPQVNLTEPTPPQSMYLDEGVPRLAEPVPPKRDFVEPKPDPEEQWTPPATAVPKTPQPPQLSVPQARGKRQASPERLHALANATQGRGEATTSRHSQGIPIRRESDRHQSYHNAEPAAGQIIGAPDTPLKLIKLLGEGAFSSVWLATDETAELALCRSASIGRGLSRRGSAGKKVTKRRRKSQSWAKQERDGRMDGLRPPPLDTHKEAEESKIGSYGELPSSPSDSRSIRSERQSDKDPPSRSLWASRSFASLNGGKMVGNGSRLVAVKMMDRAMCDANDRTRISFVREVEVLRHISHPSIVAYLHSFTTPTHHCLILEHIPGGELFTLINNDEKHARVTEVLLRRMFSELCRAVSWMHSVALVHRDIKLENILLTCDPFSPEFIMPGSNSPALDLLPAPLLKLTDFGLSRFIDPENPLLITRCGSESYAAPEIVMAIKYDGRQTDAWACGVVLYALATRHLPFDHVSVGPGSGGGSGSEHGGSMASPNGSVASSIGGKGRRSYLIRIAKNEYSWPTGENSKRLVTPGLKKVVERLLVRDPKKRATVAQLWDEEWMNAEGGTSRPTEGFRINTALDDEAGPEGAVKEEAEEIGEAPNTAQEDAEAEGATLGPEETDEMPDPASGLLMDGESIAHVAKIDVN
ncbi:hypothetical protein FRB90_012193 [Tulasnella sp. 427]|nr:hypothetical protein FRB90_012193 [Tulasnella sp. 427]